MDPSPDLLPELTRAWPTTVPHVQAALSAGAIESSALHQRRTGMP